MEFDWAVCRASRDALEPSKDKVQGEVNAWR